MERQAAKYKKTQGQRTILGSLPGHRSVAIFLFFIAFSLPLRAQKTDYTHWVNPFIGTGGHGHTFPGATTPFGMVQLSPDTRTDNWDGSSGYHYSDDVIYGFSHTHLSGTGIPDYCDILLMPTVGTARTSADQFKTAARFSHANEAASPGYYSVRLDNGIQVELTSTGRVGVHRYTFPEGQKATVILDLLWRDKLLDSKMVLFGDHVIAGYRRSSSWAADQIIYFAAEFSKPFSVRFAERRGGSEGPLMTSAADRRLRIPLKTSLDFDISDGSSLTVKVALSPVSIEGARKNLATEMPGWDFDKVRADAKAAWNKELSKIEVSGGTDAQTTTFYTALYHTMIQPNIFEDVDGSYRGHDGKVHNIKTDGVSAGRSDGETSSARSRAPAISTSRSPSHEYTVFSLWDTFRAAHPLYTIIDQKRTVDFINTFIRQYEQGGRLPVWELAGNETDCMIGYHAVSVIADAMAKGIEGFDYEKAYEAAKHSAELDRDGLAAYKKRGYISMEDENESVSKTLEYAYDDWCLSEMAKLLLKARARTVVENAVNREPPRWSAADLGGLERDSEKYAQRARSFENLFDPSTGFMRPKKNGGFLAPFAPNEVTFNYTEGNAWVYSFFVPQDVTRLMELHGGREKFAAKLDQLFSTTDKLAGREQPDITGLIGQYAHGNEPSHHIAYLYDYVGQPWKTQRLVRKIMDEFYKPEPDGLIGNEDCGQMSAWYIMSALGIYEVTPGSAVYAFGTPLFKEAKIRLENGKTFTVRAPKVSAASFYISSAKLNGSPYKKAFITHDDLMKGGVLEFEMADAPVETAFTEFPASATGGDFVAVPVVSGQRVFAKDAQVVIRSNTANTRVTYTTDGSEPVIPSVLPRDLVDPRGGGAAFTVDKTTSIKAIAFNDKGDRSQVVDATFYRMPHDWTVKIAHKYNRQYTGGGDEGLIDGIRGTTSFASGEWQGYQPQDLVATIDLKKDTLVSEVGGGFLQNAGSWIWMPTHIEFETSMDGVNFTRVADIKTDIAVDDMRETIRDYTAKVTPVTARYVRVHAYNLGKIPSWHPGAGNDAFIFVDEVWVR
jgi:putative alpha-1,2-mannosidase